MKLPNVSDLVKGAISTAFGLVATLYFIDALKNTDYGNSVLATLWSFVTNAAAWDPKAWATLVFACVALLAATAVASALVNTVATLASTYLTSGKKSSHEEQVSA